MPASLSRLNLCYSAPTTHNTVRVTLIASADMFQREAALMMDDLSIWGGADKRRTTGDMVNVDGAFHPTVQEVSWEIHSSRLSDALLIMHQQAGADIATDKGFVQRLNNDASLKSADRQMT